MKDKLKKMVTLDAPPGSLGERIAQRMDQAQDEGHGKPMDCMRKWLQSGFWMDDLGHGIVDTLLAMHREGHTRSMSQQQKAEFLVQLIQRTQWADTPTPPVTPQSRVKSVPVDSVGTNKDTPAKKTTLGRHLA